MKLIPKKTILKVKPYVPGKPAEEVKRELGLRSVIKLASNENPYAPSPLVLKEIEKAAKNINRYPFSDCYYLKKVLSKKLNVKEDQLVFGNGSDEVIVLAIRAFVNPGDEVVIAKPSFLIYEIASKIEGAKIKAIPLKDFKYDLDSMLNAVTKKTKIIFLGNPDNPSGKYFTKSEMKNFLKKVPENVLVFIDEAYYEYVNEKDYVDSLALIKSYNNVIVTRTFSKMYGLAGLRVGYGIANKELIDIFNRLREPFNVNSVAQAAALGCLKDKSYYRLVFKMIEEQRAYLYGSLKKLGLDFVETWTNFILIRIKEDVNDVCAKLMKKGVIVRNISAWGLKGYIRVSIGTEKENKKFIKVLKEIL